MVAPCRLTVVEQVYHQAVDGQPSSCPGKFGRFLLTDEQPYGPRKMKVGEAWVPLEAGWVVRASQLVIEGEESRAGEADPANPGVVEVAVLPPEGQALTMHSPPTPEPVAFAVLTPGRPGGESLRLRPIDLKRIVLRCPAGQATVKVFLVPE